MFYVLELEFSPAMTVCQCKKGNQYYAIEVTRLSLATANRKRIAEDIYDAVVAKYSQINGFYKRKTGKWGGILVISNGRDYFVAGRYEERNCELQPRTVAAVLEQEWKSLKITLNYTYLHHIVITMGKDVNKAVVDPRL